MCRGLSFSPPDVQGLAAIAELEPLLTALHAPAADALLRTQALLTAARVAASSAGDVAASPFTASTLQSARHVLVRGCQLVEGVPSVAASL
jgi:hypothetical protein